MMMTTFLEEKAHHPVITSPLNLTMTMTIPLLVHHPEAGPRIPPRHPATATHPTTQSHKNPGQSPVKLWPL